MSQPDTIFALATPAASAPVAMLRVSGPAVPAILKAICDQPFQRSSIEFTLALPLGDVPARAWLLPAPNTLTGDDTLELFVPGNAPIIRQLEQRLRDLGARDAEPGEFTRRALDSGKLDLSRAEAVLQLINSSDETTRRQAVADLKGDTAVKMAALTERLRAISARFEMLFDFSEEEHANAEEASLRADLAGLVKDLADIGTIDNARPRREHPVIALFGPPNAGKSTLFNALLGKPRSLVNATPGTTRDPVRAELKLGGHTCELVDLSGVGELDSDRGRFSETARTGALEADLLLVLQAPGDSCAAEFNALQARDGAIRTRAIWVHTKNDVQSTSGNPAGIEEVSVSGLSGAGLDTLRERLALRLDQLASGGSTSLLRTRLFEALTLLQHTDANTPPEVVASDVRRSLTLLDKGLLSEAPGEVLDLIFSRFCIGK